METSNTKTNPRELLPSPLIPTPSHLIDDISKIQRYMECPRAYFYEHVLGWRPDNTNVHLVFGDAFHKALEHIYKTRKNNKYDADELPQAMKIFITRYREEFPSVTDDEKNYPKTPATALLAFSEYISLYNNANFPDSFDVLKTEIAGCIMINDAGDLIHYKMDTVLEGDRGIFSHEHKTATSFSRTWVDDWTLKFQIFLYSYVLYALYSEKDVKGITVNGIAFKKTKTPSIDFIRVPQEKTLDMMYEFMIQLNHWYDSIQLDFQQLSNSSKNDKVLDCFHKNTQSCTKYFGCPFVSMCSVWTNPLQHADKDETPIGFRQEFWDPRREDEEATEIVNVEKKI